VGSAYPAFLAVFRDRTVVVDSRFFVTTVLPVALIMVILIGFAMHTGWTTPRIAGRDTVGFLGVAGIAAALATSFAIEAVAVGVLLLAVAAGAVAIITRDLITRRHGRRHLPTLLAHLGISVILVASGASALG